MTDKLPLVHVVDIGAIPAAGHAVRIEADATERKAIAGAFGLNEVRELVGDLDVRREPAGSIVVEGVVTARIVQDCVVTFEPVGQSIKEQVFLRFVPAGTPGALAAGNRDEASDADPDFDPPEILTGTTIDLGAIVCEFLALGIDPYPRVAGAEIPAGTAESADDKPESPFAMLGKLLDGEKH